MESSADSAGPHLAANESDIDSSMQDSNYTTLEIQRHKPSERDGCRRLGEGQRLAETKVTHKNFSKGRVIRMTMQ